MAGRYSTEEVISIICGDMELEQDGSDTLELEQDDSDTLELEQDENDSLQDEQGESNSSSEIGSGGQGAVDTKSCDVSGSTSTSKGFSDLDSSASSEQVSSEATSIESEFCGTTSNSWS